MGEVCLDDGNYGEMAFRARPTHQNQAVGMPAEGKPFQRRCNLGMIDTNLEVIWEMPVRDVPAQQKPPNGLAKAVFN